MDNTYLSNMCEDNTEMLQKIRFFQETYGWNLSKHINLEKLGHAVIDEKRANGGGDKKNIENKTVMTRSITCFC